MNIEQKELQASNLVRLHAVDLACTYTKNAEDFEAATLALLWVAFSSEAIAQGLTHWRGAELGDI